MINVQGWTLGHCPHVSIFIWKLNFFFTDTASVHTYPIKTINEDGTFRKRSPEWNFLKTLFYVNVWTDEKGLTVRKRRGHTISSNPPRAILETYSRRRMGASLSCLLYLAGLISNLIACFQANLALLILQADYSKLDRGLGNH